MGARQPESTAQAGEGPPHKALTPRSISLLRSMTSFPGQLFRPLKNCNRFQSIQAQSKNTVQAGLLGHGAHRGEGRGGVGRGGGGE